MLYSCFLSRCVLFDAYAYMTDNEFQYLMDEVLRIVKESESKDEAVKKLQGLIENKNSIV